MQLAQPVLYVCLTAESLDQGTLHPLFTLQNNEPVPQFIETGCKPVGLLGLVTMFSPSPPPRKNRPPYTIFENSVIINFLQEPMINRDRSNVDCRLVADDC